MDGGLPIKKKAWYKKWWGLALLFLLLILFSLFFAFAFSVYGIYREQRSLPATIKISPIDQATSDIIFRDNDNYWIGSAQPKVTIVEFGDFACPSCRNSFPKIREIGLKYGKDVKIVFRDYPIITEKSADLAMAARCAGEQGLFWLMFDKLYINQGISEKADLVKLARTIGADTVKFSFCLEQQKYLDNINIDIADAESLALNGTPTWFINGNKIEGDIPYDLFIQIIEKLIK